MDGLADDYVINEHGDLVPVEADECECECEDGWEATGLQALAVITQEMSGEVSIRVFGTPSEELVTALHTAMRDIIPQVGN